MAAAVNMPNAQQYWNTPAAKLLLSAGLAVSLIIIFLTFGQPILIMAHVAGLLGLGASVMQFLQPVSGRVDVYTRTKAMVVLGIVILILEVVAALQLVWSFELTTLVCRDASADMMDCRNAYIFLTAITLLMALHGWLYSRVLQRARTAQQLMNPVSSGMVPIA